MKKYWKLLQKNQATLDFEKRLWRASFRTYLTETELVDRHISYDGEFKIDYTYYQAFIYTVQTRGYSRFHALVNEEFRYALALFFINQLKKRRKFSSILYSN